MSLKTPILFLVFNRPAVTRLVFEKIRQARPSKLYFAADGPRSGKAEDSRLCQEAREIVLNGIDWPCELNTLLRTENLGCGRAVASAIDWFFSQEEEGVILEDDCLPCESFFTFCSTLLKMYRDHENIMMISGTNPLLKLKHTDTSYVFSAYGGIWGWATWKRAWARYDFNIKSWSLPNNKLLVANFFNRQDDLEYFSARFDEALAGEKVPSWDYQWFYTRIILKGLSIVPSRNLVTNLGFGEDATHTFDKGSMQARLKRYSLKFPLKAPGKIKVDESFDTLAYKTPASVRSTFFHPRVVQRKLMNLISRLK